ncbi:hypothetical protein B0H16DRAFT_1876745 [Mycena metata]|uniref:C2H2-type domain-containing protein n=1 Tax=Mycena metata TaxID=1033252 RepID=A0AAD7KEX4_9AGAR|nr:hypothetical protein B0H16DRAFT_1876745 [Mycena metata]
MAFISNADNFTLGEGTYINVQGSYHVHNNNRTKCRRDEIEGSLWHDSHRQLEENGFEVIRQKNLQLIRQIGSGPGYLLHAGLIQERAVTVKVFNGSSPMARQQLEVSLLKGVVHPNVPLIKGVSSTTSAAQFIAYENVCCRNAKGPLADALQNRTTSIRLGFQMVADLSAGLGYLSVQSTSLGGMKVEDFDVFLDVHHRFLLIINPKSPAEADANSESSPEESSWALFNGLCHKVLSSANRVLHTEEIDRDPVLLLPTFPASQKSDSSLFFIGSPSSPDQQDDAGGHANSVGDPRREYVWRAVDRGKQSLATVSEHMTTHLDLALARLQKLTQTDRQRAHRCRGYMREEITLAPTIVDSAVVAHDTPRPLEICSICHEIVGSDEKFRCICGDFSPGSGYTVKCTVCKLWSHGECAGAVERDFICRLCEGSGNPGVRTGSLSPLLGLDDDTGLNLLLGETSLFSSRNDSDSQPPSTPFFKREVASENIRHANAKSRLAPVTFQCPFENCSSTFTASQSLINHINTHNKYRPHRCPCGLSFTAQGILSRYKKRCTSPLDARRPYRPVNTHTTGGQ